MTRIERILGASLVLAGLTLFAWFALLDYGAESYDEGFAAAIVVGKERRDADAEINRQIEIDLRSQLTIKDANAFKKEQYHAETIAATQRRMRTGTDSLHCPAGPVPSATTTDARPAAGELAPDPIGPQLVPEAAADLVGIASDVERLVRQYDRVVERFEACRAVNAK